MCMQFAVRALEAGNQPPDGDPEHPAPPLWALGAIMTKLGVGATTMENHDQARLNTCGEHYEDKALGSHLCVRDFPDRASPLLRPTAPSPAW